jgi:TRAP-type C4-dicarboxylate transport system permease small subunit
MGPEALLPAARENGKEHQKMQALSALLGRIFGYMCLALSVLVSAETIMRKAFDVSLQGADELGGYTLAVTSSLAFSVALIGRNHMRIDLLHFRLPPVAQAVLNWLAVVSVAAFAGLLAWTAYDIVADSVEYHSTAPTPWATPLVYPQGLWYAGLAIFALVSAVLAVRATIYLLRGRVEDLCVAFSPKAATEELDEEIKAAKSRATGHIGKAAE